MRIAIFSDNFYPELSGISDSIITVGRELVGLGNTVRFYAPWYSKKDYRKVNLLPQELHPGFHMNVERFFSLPFPSGTGQGRAVIPTGFRSLRIKKFDPDIIHVHLPFGTGVEGLIAAKLLNIPLIGTNHTPLEEFIRYSPVRTNWFTKTLLNYNAWFYNQCQFVSSPAHKIIEGMEKRGFNRQAEKISNPIHVAEFSSHRHPSVKEKFGLSRFTVLYAGRLAPEKRIDIILKAGSVLKNKIKEMTITLVGSGSEEKNLKELAKELGMEDSVKFLGFLSREDLVDSYKASEVFVIMSTAETQSISMMQAMAAGLPVIAARSWGLAEYVNEKNGFLVSPDAVEELAEKILYLFENPGARRKLGEEGKKFVSQFSPERIAQKWEGIYQNAAKELY